MKMLANQGCWSPEAPSSSHYTTQRHMSTIHISMTAPASHNPNLYMQTRTNNLDTCQELQHTSASDATLTHIQLGPASVHAGVLTRMLWQLLPVTLYLWSRVHSGGTLPPYHRVTALLSHTATNDMQLSLTVLTTTSQLLLPVSYPIPHVSILKY